MATTITPTFGAADQAFTITLSSLASGSARESTVISTTGFRDILVMASIVTGAGTAASEQAVIIYSYANTGGSTYPDAVTGSDANITLNNPANIQRLGSVRTPAATTAYKAGPWSMAANYGGTLPSKVGVVVEAQNGFTLNAAASAHAILYQGVYDTAT